MDKAKLEAEREAEEEREAEAEREYCQKLIFQILRRTQAASNMGIGISPEQAILLLLFDALGSITSELSQLREAIEKINSSN
ncbi:hypothetical protein HY772_10270 [Candidatus Woesearchaeota archaeon]|nr:hypothetical protein [Candidatus Woesearchaeota archaeon]